MIEKFAVIVPVYGQFDYVIRCLKSLVRHTSDYRCIIIDDTSPDWDDAWLEEFRKIVPAEHLYFERFETNRGLTAAWNRGLELARQFGHPYAALVNSDTLFTPGWLLRTLIALEKVDLVGPMSNAAGGLRNQQIENMLRGYKADDKEDSLKELSAKLTRKFSGRIKRGFVNGFWMAAKTEVWWANAFDATHVFDPKNRLTGNESEFQKRFRGPIGTAQDVFIFHYRSASRGLKDLNPDFCVGSFRPAIGKNGEPKEAKPATPHAFNTSCVSGRSDLIGFIPTSAKRILDVGCSAGAVGAKLKARQQAHVTGIEYDPAMAQVAIGVLDRVIQGSAETVCVEQAMDGEMFDCIIFADVLEHLSDPWAVLARYCRVLRPGGVVVVSLPNIRHFSTIGNLLFKGYWPYRERGIHYQTHLRFFTKRNIEELFEFGNLRIQKWERIYRLIERPHEWNNHARHFAIPPFRELLTSQYYVLAQK